MSNINRDYLCILDVKTGAINAPKMYFYNTDRSTSNIYVQLVVKETIVSATPIENATDFVIEAKIVKPNGFVKEMTGQLVNEADAIYEFDLPEDFTDLTGINQVEFWVRAKVSDREERITSASTKYTVKGSILNSIDDDIEDDNDYPIFLALMERVERLDKEVTEVSLATKVLNEEAKGELAKIKADEVEIANNEAIRQAQEAAREYSEDTRGANESRRIQAEVAREQAEATRQEQEELREDNEITRQSNEASREAAEQTRQTNENTRIANENARNEAETARAGAEASRVTAENNRETQETLRQEAEADRVTAEQAREASNTAMRQDITSMQNDISNFETATNREIEEIRTSTGQGIDTIKVMVENQNAKIDYIKENDRKQDILINGIFNSQDNKLTSTLEGNVHNLVESKPGLLYVDEIVGNTMVNCNKEADKSIVLAGAINEEGTNNITLTQGVDGAKADVYVEGNTMVNVCDQEEPVAITKSYTVETGNHISLEGDYDGKCRPVVTGNTLVNLLKVNSRGWGIWPRINFSTSLLKLNTIYTVIIDIPEGFQYALTSTGNTKTYLEYGSDRVRKFTYDVSYNEIVIHINDKGNTELTQEQINNIKPIILEGDYTNKPIPDYFEGMQSSFEDKVVTQDMVDSGKELAENLGKYKVEYKVTGKNKFDGELVKGYWYNASIINDNNAVANKNNIPVKPNMTYTISIENYAGKIYMAELDSQSKEIKSFVKKSGENITTSASTKYLRFCTDKGILLDVNVHIQIEEGSTATAYEPYKEQIKTYYLNSPLLEGDTIEDNGNNVVHVHRYRKAVLDDSLNWVYFNNKLIEKVNTIDFYVPDYPGVSNSIVICDKFKTSNSNTFMEDKESISGLGGTGTNIWLSINKSKLQTQDANGLKQWLQQNPITLVYGLASPTYEVISHNDSILTDSYVSGHLDFDTAVPVERVSFKRWQSSVRYLYPNTEYSIQFESDNIGNMAMVFLGNKFSGAPSVIKGINKFNFTTGNDVSFPYFSMDGIGFNASNIVVTEATNGDFGYFKGMKSVGEQEGNKIEILSSNKNLFNKDEIITGKYQNPGNYRYAITNNDKHAIFKLKVKPNTTYYISEALTGAFYSNNIPLNWINGKQANFTTPSNCNLVILNIPNYSTKDLDSIVILENEEIVETVIHQSNKKQILCDPLRKVGDVADRYVLIDGKWYIERNCGKLDLSNLSWKSPVLDDNDILRFWTNINKYNPKSGSEVIYDMLPNVGYSKLELRDCEGIGIKVASDSIDIDINLSKTRNVSNNEQLLEWLSLKSPIAIYQLASPVYEPIDYNPLDIYSDTTHISINSNIPAKIKARNHGYNCMLKPSTTYTATYSIDGAPQKTTIVTPATLDDATRFTGTGTLKNFLLLEGDISNPPAFFSGMRSSFDQEYDEVKGKWKVNIRVEGVDTYNDITIYINEPLRKGDIIRAENRKILVERHMGEVVYDGSDDRNINTYGFEGGSSQTNTLGFSISNPKAKTEYNLNNFYCDKLKFIDSIWSKNRDYQGINANNLNEFLFRINKAELQTQNIAGFKQWLSENPITIVYELASPIIEEVETDYTRLMLESYENATVYFNSHIFPTSTIRYQANVISTSEIMTVNDEQDMLLIDSATEIAVIKLTM